MEYAIQIKSGVINFRQLGKTMRIWAQNQVDGTYIVSIEIFKDKRSLRQNRTYWKRCAQIGYHTGYTRRQISNYLMQICGFTEDIKIGKMMQSVIMSTAELTVEQHRQLYDAQDEMVHDINEDMPPDKWLKIIDPGEYNG